MVAVVVTTRNSASTLEPCLASIRAQRGPTVDLVVVDNHSTDGTVPIALRYADRVVVAGPERSRQRNLGADAAIGDCLLFIDSDMVLPPSVAGECIDQISMGAGAVVIPERSIGEGFWAACKAFERSLYAGDDTIEAPRCFTRSAFLLAGRYDEGLYAGEDWDLANRVRASHILVARTATEILHDEGRLRLSDAMRAKFYYGGSMARYIRRHPRMARRQLVPFRKAYIRHGDKLFHSPLLATGMIVMRALEVVAGGAGLLASLRRDPHVITLGR